MTHIFVSKIPQAFDTQGSAESFKSIFSGEQNAAYLENILQKKHAQAKKQSLWTLETLARGLVSLDIDTSNLTLSKTPTGKPYFEEKEIFFSLSHDTDIVVVAISDRDVGIDIQSHRDVTREPDIAQRFFAQDECSSIQSGKLDFLTEWTKREAYAKLTDTPLASLSKAKLPDNVFFYTISVGSNTKISVATHSTHQVKITFLS